MRWLVLCLLLAARGLLLIGGEKEAPRRLRCIKEGDRRDDAELASVRRENEASDFVLLFVHVFKAAGSSIRALLRRYADKCDRKWVCLVQCSQGGAQTKNGVLECRLRDAVNVKREAVFGRSLAKGKLRRNPNAQLLGSIAHVIGGHYYYGMHRILPEGKRYAYLTVLREPVATWISGIRYHDRSLDTIEKVVSALKKSLPENPVKQKYANAVTYLVPASDQRKQPAVVKLSHARTNLQDFAVVGLVESWDATIDMMQGILDADRATPALWETHKSVTKNTAKKSLSGRDVLNRIRVKLPDLWMQITLYLDMENTLFADALVAHAKTCVAVLGSEGCPLRTSRFLRTLNDTLIAPFFVTRLTREEIVAALDERTIVNGASARIRAPKTTFPRRERARRRRPLPYDKNEP